MRCSLAKACVSRMTTESDLCRCPELAEHLNSCAGCGDVWRLHRAMLTALAAPPDVPPFGDLAPAILGKLDARPSMHPAAWMRPAAWRWAALAAMALAALALGYLIGMQPAGANAEGMAATYQEALTTLPTASADLAYLDLSGNAATPSPARSAP